MRSSSYSYLFASSDDFDLEWEIFASIASVTCLRTLERPICAFLTGGRVDSSANMYARAVVGTWSDAAVPEVRLQWDAQGQATSYEIVAGTEPAL
jgi:hypothetical protein